MVKLLPETPDNSVRQLLSEIESGNGLSLSAAARMFPAHRGTGQVGPSTVFRWLKRGVASQNGSRVKLEAVRIGSHWLTTRPAMERFISALTNFEQRTPEPDLTRKPSRQRQASQAASKRLKELGA